MFGLSRREQYLVLLLAVMVLITSLALSGNVFRDEKTNDVVLENNSDADPEGREEAKIIKVHVIGAINRAGVYELPEGSRVADAVQAAGGLGADADLNLTNLAAPLADGQQVKVYSLNQKNALSNNGVSTDLNSGETNPAGGKININTASQQQLENLTGIGPALAGRIIQYRESKGYFKSVEELKNVSGIGDKKFEQLKNEITIF